jgi:putative RecB family exonuclease
LGDRRPAELSPSAASMFQQCPQRWRFRYLDKLPDPPGEAALAGTFAHRVLELLFQEAPETRTEDRARALARIAWPETEADPAYQSLGLDDAAARRFRWLGWTAIEGLWKIEAPAQVDVVATEHQVRTMVGEVPFRGIVDRLDREDDGLVITDYKSGKAPSARFADRRLSQVLLYAAAVGASDGVRPVRARLHYLGQRTIEVQVTDAVVEPVLNELTQTWDRIGEACASDTFETKPGPLCGWCSFSDQCETGTAEIARRVELGLSTPGSALTFIRDAVAG